MLFSRFRAQTPADRMMAEYLAPIRGKLLAGITSAVLGGVMALSIPQALRYLVDTVLASGASAADVWFSAAVIGGLGLLQVFFQWFRRFLILEPATLVEMRMRETLFDKLVRLPVDFHDTWPSGQLLSRSMSDLSLTRRWVAFGLSQTTQTCTTIGIGLALMVVNAWELAVIYAIAIAPIIWIIVRTVPRIRELTRSTQQRAGDLATTVEESVHGLRVLKALGRGPHALNQFSARAEGLRGTEIAKARTLAGMSARTWMIPEAVMALCLLVAGSLVAGGHLDPGAVVAFFATAVVVTARVRDTNGIMNMYQSALVARERHYQVISAPGEENVPIDGTVRPAEPQNLSAHDVGARVTLDHVGFRYDADEQPGVPVLTDVSLEIRPGETLALVGATGSGKSTLLALLPRLYTATSGTIRVDGVETSSMPLNELRGHIAIAFEDPTLFSATVRDNVLMGVPEALGPDGEPLAWDDLSEAQRSERQDILARALEAAAADFVEDLPQGAGTQIGEEGLSLSGGQRQRLALARAIAAQPRLMLLDDPLSAVDTQTEARVVENLRKTLTGTTTVLTAHRPSTVALADRVALLRDGRIEAVGTHRELLQLPEYRHVMGTEWEAGDRRG